MQGCKVLIIFEINFFIILSVATIIYAPSSFIHAVTLWPLRSLKATLKVR